MKEKLKRIIWPLIYLVLIANVCLSFILVFRSYYYRSIFVYGSSMEPTLNGTGKYVDYGVIDDHKYAIDKLKRFQILTTYYPFANDYVGGYVHGGTNVVDKEKSSYKIKRIYGFPGETIRFDVDDEMAKYAIEAASDPYLGIYSETAQFYARKAVKFYVKAAGSDKFVEQELKFKRKISTNSFDKYRNFEWELGEDEYWVMGDNYSASSDCFSEKSPVYYDNIVGVLIAIEGTCIASRKNKTTVKSTEDGNEGTSDFYYECTSRRRHFPVFY